MSKIRRQKRTQLILGALAVFLFIGATVAAFVLVKQNQDIRQQAFDDPNDPYPTNGAGGAGGATGDNIDPELAAKGLSESGYNGVRPTSQGACGGVWMNDFCYMPGDKLSEGYVVVESATGRGYPHLVMEEVYYAPEYGAESIKETLGSEANLGSNCGGKGLAVNGTCYAYGSTVNGYVIMPARTSGCDNSAGNYCYPHLKKIEATYDQWEAAKKDYEENGNLAKLEALYKEKYGVDFSVGSLYDSGAKNADALRAQALLAALTDAAVLKESLARENDELSREGLVGDEQAIYERNQEIMARLDQSTYFDAALDGQINGIVANQTLNAAFGDLVTADGGDLNAQVTALFEEIYGYKPDANKYQDWQAILSKGLGLSVDSLQASRQQYAQEKADYEKKVAENQAEHEQNLKNFAINASRDELIGQMKNNADIRRELEDQYGSNFSAQLAAMTDRELLALLGFAQTEIPDILSRRISTQQVNAVALDFVNADVDAAKRYHADIDEVDAQLLAMLERTYGEKTAAQVLKDATGNKNEAILIKLMGEEAATDLFKTRLAVDIGSAFKEQNFDKFQKSCQELGLKNCNDVSATLEQSIELLHPNSSKEEIAALVAKTIDDYNKTSAVVANNADNEPVNLIGVGFTGMTPTQVLPSNAVDAAALANVNKTAVENYYQNLTKNTAKKAFGVSERTLNTYVLSNSKLFDADTVQNALINDILEDNYIFNRKDNKYNDYIKSLSFKEKYVIHNFQVLEKAHSQSTKSYINTMVDNSGVDVADMVAETINVTGQKVANLATYLGQNLTSSHTSGSLYLNEADVKKQQQIAANYHQKQQEAVFSQSTNEILAASMDLGGKISRDIAMASVLVAVPVAGVGAAMPVINTAMSVGNLDFAVSELGNACLLEPGSKACQSAKLNVAVATAQAVAAPLAGSQMMKSKALMQAQQGLPQTINTVRTVENLAGVKTALSSTALNVTASPLVTQGIGVAAGGLGSYQAWQNQKEACLNPDSSDCNLATINAVFASATTGFSAIFGLGETAYNQFTGNDFSTGLRNLDKGMDVALAISGGVIDAQSALNQCLMYDDPASCVNAVISGVTSIGMDLESMKMRSSQEKFAAIAEVNKKIAADFNESNFSDLYAQEYADQLLAINRRTDIDDAQKAVFSDAITETHQKMQDLVVKNRSLENIDAEIRRATENFSTDSQEMAKINDLVLERSKIVADLGKIISETGEQIKDSQLIKQQEALLAKANDQELVNSYQQKVAIQERESAALAKLPVDEVAAFQKKTGLGGLFQSDNAKNRVLEVLSLEQNLTRKAELSTGLSKVANLDSEIQGLVAKGQIPDYEQARLNDLQSQKDILVKSLGDGEASVNALKKELASVDQQINASDPNKRNIFQKALDVFAGHEKKNSNSALSNFN